MNDFISQQINQNIIPWLLEHGLAIVAILAAAFIIRRFSGMFIERAVRKLVVTDRYTNTEAEKKREDTLINVFNGAISVLVWVMAGLMVLSEAGLDIGPMLAAAGVAGLAFGFGGQYLIKDLISGFFIIMENQYRVGDVACIGDKCGLVEKVNLRLTVLRDLDGTVHHIPNGEVAKASNLSKGFSRVNINIGISYNSNLEKVIKVVNKVGEDMASDPDWRDFIKEAPKFLRVDDFADSAVVIKILGETEPLKQWDVTGELRKRLKIAFDKEGITIPFPQRTLHFPNTEGAQLKSGDVNVKPIAGSPDTPAATAKAKSE